VVEMGWQVKMQITASAPRAHFKYKVCVTTQEMREGPSEPLCRRRLQTTLSCIGKEPMWLTLRKSHGIRLGQVRITEMSVKRTIDEVSNYQGWRQNGGSQTTPG